MVPMASLNACKHLGRELVGRLQDGLSRQCSTGSGGTDQVCQAQAFNHTQFERSLAQHACAWASNGSQLISAMWLLLKVGMSGRCFVSVIVIGCSCIVLSLWAWL
jgi:hypothetical protein